MIYHLSQYLSDSFSFPGKHLMNFITFRAGIALILSLFISIGIGKHIIEYLRKMQVGEIVRDLGLQGQGSKAGTPTMGGIIIIIATLVPCLLVGNLTNVYMILMIIATIWLGALGFADDYLKKMRHDKEGMKGKFKIIGQVGLGLIVGLTMYLSPDITIRQNIEYENPSNHQITVQYESNDEKSTATTIPFVKSNNFDYSSITSFMGRHAQTGGWILFILITIFVITAVSNGANLTDGLDGLCAGTSAVIAVALVIMCYLSGNIIYSSYLNIMYIPHSSELVVFGAAFIGATVGFLWYNFFPADVFMGDTGSLTIGGIIAVFALLIHKELLIPLLCAIYFVEDLSVMMQVAYFKFTKRKYGEGHRIFKMTPLHHHYQKDYEPGTNVLWKHPLKGIPETKIVMRFILVALGLAVATFVTLKIR